MRIVCLSDTHNRIPAVPKGDIPIHAGDLSVSGTVKEVQAQLDWLKTLPHPHKIVIAGNHDKVFGSATEKARLDSTGLQYLEDSSTTVEIRGRRFNVFGSPWTRKTGSWVFEYPAAQNFWHGRVHSKPTSW